MDTVMIAPSRGEEVDVLAKAKQRRFTLEYKRRILQEADRAANRTPRPLAAASPKATEVWAVMADRGYGYYSHKHIDGAETQPRPEAPDIRSQQLQKGSHS